MGEIWRSLCGNKSLVLKKVGPMVAHSAQPVWSPKLYSNYVLIYFTLRKLTEDLQLSNKFFTVTLSTKQVYNTTKQAIKKSCHKLYNFIIHFSMYKTSYVKLHASVDKFYLCTVMLHDSFFNKTYPEVSECLQNTLLLWIPTGIIWLLLPFYIYHQTAKRNKVPIPHNCLNVTKMRFSLFFLTHELCQPKRMNYRTNCI
ncbi:hypothetical protein KUTeg_001060 [Tegillarca granosa]|uniref:Uncharacterized protein n=1 Tax=Tegillarca granosa TaxID=220873 RepID=A0ABQ9FVU4_TEGGR|nr:hypothetical protein KUTeg_001060 [Tegillarca granosa]